MWKYKFHWASASRWDPLGAGALFVGRQSLNEFHIAQPLVFETMPQVKGIDTPTIDFALPGNGDKASFQQALMDSLWSEGVRPSNYRHEAGQTEKHLQDMRRLVEHMHGMKFDG